VWDLVGNNLVMQAVLNPYSTNPKAALSPAPPAPTTTASYVWSIIVYFPNRGDYYYEVSGYIFDTTPKFFYKGYITFLVL